MCETFTRNSKAALGLVGGDAVRCFNTVCMGFRSEPLSKCVALLVSYSLCLVQLHRVRLCVTFGRYEMCLTAACAVPSVRTPTTVLSSAHDH